MSETTVSNCRLIISIFIWNRTTLKKGLSPHLLPGMNCEINEDDCRGSPCQHGGTCIDHVAAYSCNCVAGFEGEHCEINIDECNSSPCQNNATCVDLVWAYK